MIDHIHERLNQWAYWVARGRRVSGLGYPSSSVYANATRGGNFDPGVDESAWAVEKAIHELKPYLAETVLQVYLRAGTMQTHAKALHVSPKTIYDRLQRAHEDIYVWLLRYQDTRRTQST